jgi:hypothetical protein
VESVRARSSGGDGGRLADTAGGRDPEDAEGEKELVLVEDANGREELKLVEGASNKKELKP